MWIALACAVVLSGLIPQGGNMPEVFMRPFWFSFRALLGDFDLSIVYELTGDSMTPNSFLMGYAAILVILVYTFFTTIVVINLMIAQMSRSFEEIDNQSSIYRKYQLVEIVREYKDSRSPVPPPFIIFRFIWKRSLKWLSKCCPSKGGFEVGFSDEMSVAKAEVFLKRERECQAQYLRRKDKDDEVSTRLERAAQDTMQLREDMEKVFEVCNGRFDKLEKINHERLGSIERSLAALSHAQTASKSAAPLPSPAKSKSGTAAMSYAPSYPPPTAGTDKDQSSPSALLSDSTQRVSLSPREVQMITLLRATIDDGERDGAGDENLRI
jgi:hypothetical protein